MADLKARMLSGEGPAMFICPECGESVLELYSARHREWHVKQRHTQHIRTFISDYLSEKNTLEADVGHRVPDFYSTWLKGIGLSGWDADGNPILDSPAPGYDKEAIKAEASRSRAWKRSGRLSGWPTFRN
jgi:hypothetical protein